MPIDEGALAGSQSSSIAHPYPRTATMVFRFSWKQS